jgi:hypothetical protein
VPESRLPTEVELVFEVMPCNALRVAQEPGRTPHACSYFRSWGRYHSYDYDVDGPPPVPGIVQRSVYLGRAALVPEMLSGCRKAPILAVGINPNLPGWWPATRSALNPLFDDYAQYAHYFRYRATAKLRLRQDDYERFGGGPDDSPLGDTELRVPEDAAGKRAIAVELQEQRMYQEYQALLDSLAAEMGWTDHALAVGEDLSYGNMVACPSAKWTTRPDPQDPSLPPMTAEQRSGIVAECFRERRYFPRQLFQSLPPVLLVFSQNTANAFIGEMQARFVAGNPVLGEPVGDLLGREIRLDYGTLPDGTRLDARVVFAAHPTGNPDDWQAARPRVIEQLLSAAREGRLRLNAATKHLARGRGACTFCPVLEIGQCDYTEELQPLVVMPGVAALGSPLMEKQVQSALLGAHPAASGPVGEIWAGTDSEAASR